MDTILEFIGHQLESLKMQMLRNATDFLSIEYKILVQDLSISTLAETSQYIYCIELKYSLQWLWPPSVVNTRLRDFEIPSNA